MKKIIFAIGLILGIIGIFMVLDTMSKPQITEDQAGIGALGMVFIVAGFTILFISMLMSKPPEGNLKKLYKWDLYRGLIGVPIWFFVILTSWGAIDALSTSSLTPEMALEHPGLFPAFTLWFGSYILGDLMGLEEFVFILTSIRIPVIFMLLNILLALHFDIKNNWLGRATLFSIAMIPFIYMWLETFLLVPPVYGLLDGTIDYVIFFGFNPLIIFIEIVSQIVLNVSVIYAGMLLYRERRFAKSLKIYNI
ncbi:hypothetical protein KAT95_02740 [Candidatus Parcubacteria bacterium]|nr:hypothetical protein [Candidatus Parcubacteria bacterium]